MYGSVTKKEAECAARAVTKHTCEGCAFHKQKECKVDKAKRASAQRSLWIASVFLLFFMVCEFAGGYLAKSLALMSDAVHLLSDFASLMISVFSIWVSSRPQSTRYSFGYQRAETLGAVLSCMLIWTLTALLAQEAIRRLQNPQIVDGEMMFAVACCGIVMNIIMAAILHGSGHSHTHGLTGGSHGHSHSHTHAHSHGHTEEVEEEQQVVDKIEEADATGAIENEITPLSVPKKKSRKLLSDNLNVRSAFVHVLGDLVQSIGVAIAGSMVWYDAKRFHYADPICTLGFSLIVLYTTRFVMRDAFRVLMESVPKNVDLKELRADLLALPGVHDVADLHVWMLSLSQTAMSCHLIAKEHACGEVKAVGGDGSVVVVEGGNEASETPKTQMRKSADSSQAKILEKAKEVCEDKYGISHVTVQVEMLSGKCTHDNSCSKAGVQA